MRCRKTGRSGEGVKWGEVDWSGIFYGFLRFPMGLFVVQWVDWLVCVKVTEYFMFSLRPSAGPFARDLRLLKYFEAAFGWTKPCSASGRGTAILQCPKLRLPHSEGVSATQVN